MGLENILICVFILIICIILWFMVGRNKLLSYEGRAVTGVLPIFSPPVLENEKQIIEDNLIEQYDPPKESNLPYLDQLLMGDISAKLGTPYAFDISGLNKFTEKEILDKFDYNMLMAKDTLGDKMFETQKKWVETVGPKARNNLRNVDDLEVENSVPAWGINAFNKPAPRHTRDPLFETELQPEDFDRYRSGYRLVLGQAL